MRLKGSSYREKGDEENSLSWDINVLTYDAIGAAIGVSRFAIMNHLEAYIVLNETDIDPTLRRVMNEIE